MATDRPGSQIVNGVDTNFETALRRGKDGFMESPRFDRISPELKIKFLELFEKTGDFTQASNFIGVSSRIMRWHKANDPEFKALIDESIDRQCDKMEAVTLKVGLTDKGVIDRRAWLNAKRPSVWDPNRNVMPSGSIQISLTIGSANPIPAVDTTAINYEPLGTPPPDPNPALPTTGSEEPSRGSSVNET